MLTIIYLAKLMADFVLKKNHVNLRLILSTLDFIPFQMYNDETSP